MFEKDPLEKIVLKFLISFIIGIIGVYLLAPALSIFAVMPRTGSSLSDAFMFIIIPLCAVFFVIYRIFKVFAA